MSTNLVSRKASETGKIRRNKTLLTIALILTLAAGIFATLPITTAHSPGWTIPTYAYLAVSPDPVGINQPVFIVMWLDKVPPTAAGNAGDRWTHFTVEVSKPDGKIDKLGPFTSDATSSTFTKYTPTQIGTYTFVFKFPGQVASLYNPLNGLPGDATNAFVNDTFTASSATATLTVQQEQIAPVPDYQLPTDYWTRPIEGQNTAWDAIASNWLLGGYTYLYALVQPNGIAPNTPHIMWTKPFQDGGVVGGKYAFAGGMTFYDSLSYETKFGSALIMYGRYYYTLPRSDATSGNGYVCVDLRTGETLWWKNETMPSFGQYYMYDSPNQHGVIANGYMWKSVTDAANGGTVWMAYDPIDGNWLFNETNVPSGTSIYGPNGEILVYQFNNNAHWLALWNNTAAPNLVLTPGTTTNAWQFRPVGKNVNASTAYSWNVTLPAMPVGSANPSILKIIPDDMMICTINFPAIYAYIGGGMFGTPTNMTEVMWAISLKPTSRGTLLWTKPFTPPDGNITRGLGPVDPLTRVFTMTDKETMQWLGFSLDTGEQLWGPVGNTRAYQYYGSPMFPGQTGYAYLGHLYVGGYGGIVYCYDLKTGNLLWTYGNGGVGNSTNSGLDTPWGNYPTYPCAFADGKIFVYTSEHSPNAPPYKGARVRAIDANTGKEVWTLMSWSSSAFVIADGFASYLNLYDNQITTIGKGPSATTVQTPLTAITQGQSIVIQGTVTDQTPSPEAKGTPAISDKDMGSWMEYLYMQKPIPETATGVSVKLYYAGSDGIEKEIGTVTSDASGMFMKMWTPPAPGEYKIIASFEGSEAYWPSYAESAVGVVAAAPSPSQAATPATPTIAPPTSTPTQTPSPSQPQAPTQSPNTMLYVGIATFIIIAAIAAVAIILRRRK